MALQLGDAVFGRSDWSQALLILYLALRMFMQRLSLLEAIIQANFARRAMLMSLAFLKPSPPLFLGWQSLSHAFKARKFPSWFLGFH